jgi:dipeptidyl aminopeptidase/acylaminoacyl peptidase
VYRILQARGTPTDFRVFPGEKHVFGSPWAIEEMLVRTLAWMRRFLLEA